MSERTYRLELTADEARTLCLRGELPEGAPRTTLAKLRALRDQVDSDRERDELRLPWRVERVLVNDEEGWTIVGCDGRTAPVSRRAASLRAAAPELLEAVQAAKRYRDEVLAPHCSCETFDKVALPAIERALRKVASGQPEEP